MEILMFVADLYYPDNSSNGPGHNRGATVEMMQGDAELRAAAPTNIAWLLAIIDRCAPSGVRGGDDGR